MFLAVNDLARSRPFYAALMPRLGYPGVWDAGGVIGFLSPGGSFWLKQADPRYAGETLGRGRQWPRGLAGGGTAAGRERGERGSRPPTLTPQ